jgi:hypothetical protein
MHKAVGILEYGPTTNRVVLNVDQGIADFYRSLIPRAWPRNPQRYQAHVSVVRREQPPNMDVWKKYDGHEVEIEYSPEIVWDERYYWLNVQCQRLCEIRVELGLAPFPWWRNKFHITVANRKDLSANGT